MVYCSYVIFFSTMNKPICEGILQLDENSYVQQIHEFFHYIMQLSEKEINANKQIYHSIMQLYQTSQMQMDFS